VLKYEVTLTTELNKVQCCPRSLYSDFEPTKVGKQL